jgi:hypothetical protein
MVNLIKHGRRAQKFKNDPFGSIVDSLVAIVINLVIPFPVGKQVLLQFRGQVLGCLAGGVILGLFLITIIGALFFSPLLLTSGLFSRIGFSAPDITDIPDIGFIQTNAPKQNPLGGVGMQYTTLTAGFMDPNYLLKFGKNHFGIDLVPNDTYFKESEGFKQTRHVIVYATHSGRMRYYLDTYGGETVEITNNESSIKTIYIHMSQVFVKTGQIAKAGTPVGVMGKTGFATAEHVHYEIRVQKNGVWTAINPINYIQ